jgi:hypothetical protein
MTLFSFRLSNGGPCTVKPLVRLSNPVGASVGAAFAPMLGSSSESTAAPR